MPRNPKSKWTIKAVARAGKGQRQRLEQVIQQERELYNSALQVLESAHQNGTNLELQNLEKQLTQVRREYPEHSEILRRVSISTLKRATTAWNGHANPREETTPRGKPRQKTTERFRTIVLDAPIQPIIRLSIQARQPYPEYIQSARRVEQHGIRLVPEDNELTTGSYVMVDPAGRFFDNTARKHTYSQPILAVGADAALRELSVNRERFIARDGLYNWLNQEKQGGTDGNPP